MRKLFLVGVLFVFFTGCVTFQTQNGLSGSAGLNGEDSGYRGLPLSTVRPVEVKRKEKKRTEQKESVNRAARDEFQGESPGGLQTENRQQRQEVRFEFNYTRMSLDTLKQMVMEITGRNLVVSDYEKNTVDLQCRASDFVECLRTAFGECEVSELPDAYSVRCIVTRSFVLPYVDAVTSLRVSSATTGTTGTTTGTTTAGTTSTTGGLGVQIEQERKTEYYKYLEESVKKMLSRKGSVYVSPSGVMVVTDYKVIVDEVERMLKAERQQILPVIFKIRVVKIDLSDEYQAGVDWNRILSNSVTKNLNLQIAGSTNVTAPVLTIGMQSASFSGVIKALEKFGHAEVITEWEVSAMPGETVMRKRTTTIPYLKSITTTSITETEFQQTPEIEKEEVGFSVSLNYIKQDSRRLVVNGVIDARSLKEMAKFQFGDIPIESPVVEQDFVRFHAVAEYDRPIVISGFKVSTRETEKKTVPLLGKIPLLGWLFGHSREGSSSVQYMVVITPSKMDIDISAVNAVIESK